MGTRDRGGGGGSASRVGDGDVDLGEGWDWGSIPRLLSSACLFLCSGWVRFPPAPLCFPPLLTSSARSSENLCRGNSLGVVGGAARLRANRLLLAGAQLWMMADWRVWQSVTQKGIALIATCFIRIVLLGI